MPGYRRSRPRSVLRAILDYTIDPLVRGRHDECCSNITGSSSARWAVRDGVPTFSLPTAGTLSLQPTTSRRSLYRTSLCEIAKGEAALLLRLRIGNPNHYNNAGCSKKALPSPLRTSNSPDLCSTLSRKRTRCVRGFGPSFVVSLPNANCWADSLLEFTAMPSTNMTASVRPYRSRP